MMPVEFWELAGLDQMHYMSGMFWFVGKYSTMFFMNLLYKTSFWIFSGGFRMLARGFGMIRNVFSGDGNG
jgi:hypothetical protein